jgi:hypothetical protein
MRIPLELIYAWCQCREKHAGVDDARGLVVAKHVHLWLRLDCNDHPRIELTMIATGELY